MKLVIIFFSFFVIKATFCLTAITYDFGSCGRFGDQVVNYCKCKWLSVKYNIPLLFKPFENSQFFTCHYREHWYDQQMHGILRIVRVYNESQLLNQQPNTLYVTNYCCTILDEMSMGVGYDRLLQSLKDSLQVQNELTERQIDDSSLTVGVHIRKGSGEDPPLRSEQYFASPVNVSYAYFKKTNFFDHLAIVHGRRGGLILNLNNADAHYPGKFPPEQYYVDQLKKIEELFPLKRLYIYICSDVSDKKSLINRIKSKANLRCARFYQDFSSSAIEDFYFLLNSNILIRSSSNFSWVAELIGNHSCVFFPRYFKWDGIKLIASSIGIKN